MKVVGQRTYFQFSERNHLLEILVQHGGFLETTKNVVVCVHQFAASLYHDVSMDLVGWYLFYLGDLGFLTSPWLCRESVGGGSVCVCVIPVLEEFLLSVNFIDNGYDIKIDLN